ncbi:hypothetical protein ES288_D10G154300v1 [Gossypium darwinii]|uniref:Uncharacterized protein n=1 Tax=Gossypium darwinii TaxID=34276 RepID=A0A5D2B3L5_GOSDA|nr:hypothetical protein ES288_D10G154300v1 [Gossypium darwinii]
MTTEGERKVQSRYMVIRGPACTGAMRGRGVLVRRLAHTHERGLVLDCGAVTVA